MSGMGPIIYIQNTSANPVNNYKTPSQYHNNSSYNPATDGPMAHYKNSAGAAGPVKLKGNSLVIMPTSAGKGAAAPTTQS